MLDFMEDVDGFDTPLMPSTKHPKGKSYHVFSPDALTGMQLSAIVDITVKAQRGVEVSENDLRRLRVDDADEQEFIEKVLGKAVVDEMISDGCKWEHIKRLGLFAFTYFTISREAAEDAAKRGIFKGKAMEPQNRAARRSTSKGTSTSSASGGSKKATSKR
jgi:hypothetical protein